MKFQKIFLITLGMLSMSNSWSCRYDISALQTMCSTAGLRTVMVACPHNIYPDEMNPVPTMRLKVGCNIFEPNPPDVWHCALYQFIDDFKVCPGGEPKNTFSKPQSTCPKMTTGSIIRTDNQAVSEAIEITGSSFYLVYSSEKVPGRKDWYNLKVPVTSGTFSYPSEVNNESVMIQIAGRTISASLTPAPSLTYNFTWDGKDHNDDDVFGSQNALVKVEEGYTTAPCEVPGLALGEWEDISSGTKIPLASCGNYQATVNSPVVLGSIFASRKWIGGWDLNVHHQYDSVRRILFKGNGSTQNSDAKVQSNGDYWIISSDRSEVFVFDSSFRHKSTLNALNGDAKLSFTYSSAGELVSVEDSYGNETTIQYIGGIVTSITSPFGHVTLIGTDSHGYISSVTNPASETYNMTYTADGLLLTFEKPSGILSTMTYDSLGLLLTDSSSAGSSTTLARSDTDLGFNITETSEMGKVITHTITQNAYNYSRSTSYPNNFTSTFYENNISNSFSQTGYRSASRSNQYDSRFGDQFIMPNMESLSIGNGTQYRYFTESSDLSDPADPFSYSTLTSTWTSNGKSQVTSYIPTTKTLVSTTPLGRTNTSVLNSNGSIVSSQFSSFTPVTISYTTNGQVGQISQGSSRSILLTYDSGTGFLSSIENSLGQITSFTYDLAGRVLSQVLPDSRVISYTYDSNGNIASITPPGKSAHTMSYNGFDLISSYLPPTIAAPSSVSTTYYYNDDRDLIQITRPDGLDIDFNYGTSGNLDSMTLPSGNRNFGYYLGILNSTSSEDGVSTYPTIQENKMISDYVVLGSFSSSVFDTTNSDLLKTEEQLYVGSGSSNATFSYDDDGLLISTNKETLTRATSSGLITLIALGPAQQNFTYSSAYGELASIDAVYSSTPVYEEIMTRDDLGRILTRTETYGTGSSDVYEYSYDSSGRLAEVVKNSATVSEYVYDTNSNRTSQTIGSVTKTATYDAQDRLLTFGTKSFSYNLNGELVSMTDSSSAQTTDFEYDVLGNLKEVTLPIGTVTYKIDAFNRRISKSIDGDVEQYFIWNTSKQMIGLADSSGVLTSRFVYGSKSHVPDYMIKDGVEYQIVTNHLGSPVAVIDSSTGTIAQEIKYGEFGNIVSNTNPGFQPFGFAGCLYDEDTKLCRFGARDYDASIGRWLSKDPILFAGLDTNLYGYVMQDPINFIDPNGLRNTPADAGAVAAYRDMFTGNFIQASQVIQIKPHHALMAMAALPAIGATASLAPLALPYLTSTGLYLASNPGFAANSIDFADSLSGELGGPTTGLPSFTHGGMAGTALGMGIKQYKNSCGP